MIDDQRFAAARRDVLTYQSAPLASDLTLAGPITADLYVSISTTDADFIVKVVDVFPDDAPGKLAGYQMLVRAEVLRAKFRNSYSNPTPLTPFQDGTRRLRVARHLPYVPQGAPAHGADPVLVVPAGGPQSAAVHGHLLQRNRRTSRRRRSISIGPPRPRRTCAWACCRPRSAALKSPSPLAKPRSLGIECPEVFAPRDTIATSINRRAKMSQ